MSARITTSFTPAQLRAVNSCLAYMEADHPDVLDMIGVDLRVLTNARAQIHSAMLANEVEA